MDQSQRKLKIGILLRNRHDGPGGLEKVLSMVARYLPSQNAEAYLYSLFPLNYDFFTIGFQQVRYLQYPSILQKINHFLPAKAGRFLQKIYIKSHGDQLFTQMIEDKIDLLLVLDLSRQFIQNYPQLLKFKETSDIPILSWIHSPLTGENDQYRTSIEEAMSLFSGHLAISRGIKRELETLYHAKEISLVYNPVEYAALLPRNPRRFLYIGRIDSNKRVHSLLKQLLSLRGEWQLDIFGSTGSKQKDREFQGYIKDLALENNVRFHGWRDDPWKEIDNAGVLLLNSRKEGFGLAVVEAMQRGIPVLSANSPTGPSELIEEGINGWLYPVEEEAQGIAILQKIIDSELELPDAESIQKSVEPYSASHYIKNFVTTLKQYLP